MPELAETLIGLGDFTRAKAVLAESSQAAREAGSARLLALSQMVELLMRLFTGGKVQATESALPEPLELISVLDREGGAHNELATAWRLEVLKHGIAGHYELARHAAEWAVDYARRARNDRLVARIGGNLADFALLGPMPVTDAIAACQKLIDDGLTDRQVEGKVMCMLAQLHAMNGELEVARSLYRSGRSVLRDLGQGVFAASTANDLARVELHGGDLTFAEKEVRADLDFLAAQGERYYRSTMAALLARLVRDQGRYDEALELTKLAEELAAPGDTSVQALWRSTRATLLARAGDFALAEELARIAVDLVKPTEAPPQQAVALRELAEVLHLAGKADEARQAIAEALALYTAKGDRVMADRCRELRNSWGNDA